MLLVFLSSSSLLVFLSLFVVGIFFCRCWWCFVVVVGSVLVVVVGGVLGVFVVGVLVVGVGGGVLVVVVGGVLVVVCCWCSCPCCS